MLRGIERLNCRMSTGDITTRAFKKSERLSLEGPLDATVAVRVLQRLVAEDAASCEWDPVVVLAMGSLITSVVVGTILYRLTSQGVMKTRTCKTSDDLIEIHPPLIDTGLAPCAANELSLCTVPESFTETFDAVQGVWLLGVHPRKCSSKFDSFISGERCFAFELSVNLTTCCLSPSGEPCFSCRPADEFSRDGTSIVVVVVVVVLSCVCDAVGVV